MERETTKFHEWPSKLGPHFIGVEIRKVKAFICSYGRCFASSLENVEGYKGKPIHIQCHREDWCPSSLAKVVGIKADRVLQRGICLCYSYASKNNIFGNWTEKQMCGDYCSVNRKIKSDRYPMPISEELFDAIRFLCL